MLDLFTQPEAWIAVITLAALEIVLGIDNLVFIAIVTGRLPEERQSSARKIGLTVALATRILLLLTLSWILGLTAPIAHFGVFGREVEITGQSLILLGGGLFLIWKSTTEIYDKTELKDDELHARRGTASFGAVIANIAVMDMIFSLDSVITAVGMVNEIALMIVAIVVAMMVMIAFADPVSEFVSAHPSVKILALAFLLMIGVLLTVQALHVEVPKGYVYFAMAFSLLVELIQMRYTRNVQRRRAQVGSGEVKGAEV